MSPHVSVAASIIVILVNIGDYGIFAESVIDICSTKTDSISYSQVIQSPGYPKEIEQPYNCTLTFILPEYSIINFTAEADSELSNCTDLASDGLHLSTAATPLVPICGHHVSGKHLVEYFSEGESIPVTMNFTSPQGASLDIMGQKFSIRYQVTSILDTGEIPSRFIEYRKSEGSHYIISHGSHGNYRNNTDSTLGILGIGLNRWVRVQFPSGLHLADGETCSDHLDIVGIIGTTNTQRLCGTLPAGTIIDIVTSGVVLSFTFKTNADSTDRGFLLFYTVIPYTQDEDFFKILFSDFLHWIVLIAGLLVGLIIASIVLITLCVKIRSPAGGNADRQVAAKTIVSENKLTPVSGGASYDELDNNRNRQLKDNHVYNSV